jgi:hypothetical protein
MSKSKQAAAVLDLIQQTNMANTRATAATARASALEQENAQLRAQPPAPPPPPPPRTTWKDVRQEAYKSNPLYARQITEWARQGQINLDAPVPEPSA